MTFMRNMIALSATIQGVIAHKPRHHRGQRWKNIIVADETLADGRPVTVKLFHDDGHANALFVPIAADEF